MPTRDPRGTRFEEFRPYWVEEPFHPDEFGVRRLADAVDTRIAGGEEESTRSGFRELIDEGRSTSCSPT